MDDKTMGIKYGCMRLYDDTTPFIKRMEDGSNHYHDINKREL